MIDERFLAMLACPACRAPLRQEGPSLVCTKAGVRYPVEDGIPVLLTDRAEPRHPDERPQGGPPSE